MISASQSQNNDTGDGGRPWKASLIFNCSRYGAAAACTTTHHPNAESLVPAKQNEPHVPDDDVFVRMVRSSTNPDTVMSQYNLGILGVNLLDYVGPDCSGNEVLLFPKCYDYGDEDDIEEDIAQSAKLCGYPIKITETFCEDEECSYIKFGCHWDQTVYRASTARHYDREFSSKRARASDESRACPFHFIMRWDFNGKRWCIVSGEGYKIHSGHVMLSPVNLTDDEKGSAVSDEATLLESITTELNEAQQMAAENDSALHQEVLQVSARSFLAAELTDIVAEVENNPNQIALARRLLRDAHAQLHALRMEANNQLGGDHAERPLSNVTAFLRGLSEQQDLQGNDTEDQEQSNNQNEEHA